MEEKLEQIELIMNGRKVTLKTPGTEGLKDFLILAKSIGNMPQDKENINVLEYLDDKAMDSAISLVNKSIKKTFGEITDDIDAWVTKNFILILQEVIMLCSPENIEEKKKKEHLNKLKAISDNG